MWDKAQNHEKNWWGNCTNTFGEELKQVTYAEKMGLKFIEIDGRPFIIDLEGKGVVDIGGGPTSLLLKAINGKRAVFDPCDYPNWVATRYYEAGIFYGKVAGEDLKVLNPKPDEIWIYNVLQHTKDPEQIIKNAKANAGKIRIFEWIDAETNEMHPHQLTQEQLEKWLGAKGTVEELNGVNNCFGKAFYATV